MLVSGCCCIALWVEEHRLGALCSGEGLRYAIVLAGAFCWVFPELCLGGSGGGSPRTCLRCFCSSSCCGVLSDVQCHLVVGLCILLKVFPRIALCRFWRRFFPGVLCVRFGPPLCCPCGLKCVVWLGCVLVRFSQDGSWRFWWRFSLKLLRVVLLRQWDFVCPRGSDGLFCFPVPGVLSQIVSDVFRVYIAVCHIVERVTPSFHGTACVWCPYRTTRKVWVRPSGDSGCRFCVLRVLCVRLLSLLDCEEETVCSVGYCWLQSELLTGVSRVAVGNCILCRALLAIEWVAGWSILVLHGTYGVVVPFGHPTCIGSFSCFLVSLDGFSMLPSPVWYVYGLWAAPGWSIPWICLSAGVVTTACGLLLRRFAPSLEGYCRDGVATALEVATPTWRTLELRGKRGLDSGAESFVELSCLGRDAEVVEVFSSRCGLNSPLSHCLSLRWFRSHVVVLGVGSQLGQAAVLRAFVCFRGGFVSLFRGGEAGARLASRGRGRIVLLLVASGGGLVVVAVVSASVSSQFRSPVLGCQSVVAPACVASRPRDVSGVRGGSACGPSTLWMSKVAVLAVRRRSQLVVA
ncbi:hypothetical protein Taro_048211 [Colocasia esculenta]|uniref:Uncharacterized protein n=1 Tax=Colocasia esculenta TaxID=4460 RepID=A0A843X2B0_COLES|nr:hypothetical protein [Colocasia esculenta]